MSEGVTGDPLDPLASPPARRTTTGVILVDGARREALGETEYGCGLHALGYQRVLHRPDGWSERQCSFLGRYDGVQPLVCHEGQELRCCVEPQTPPMLKSSPGLAGAILDVLARMPLPDRA